MAIMDDVARLARELPAVTERNATTILAAQPCQAAVPRGRAGPHVRMPSFRPGVRRGVG